MGDLEQAWPLPCACLSSSYRTRRSISALDRPELAIPASDHRPSRRPAADAAAAAAAAAETTALRVSAPGLGTPPPSSSLQHPASSGDGATASDRQPAAESRGTGGSSESLGGGVLPAPATTAALPATVLHSESQQSGSATGMPGTAVGVSSGVSGGDGAAVALPVAQQGGDVMDLDPAADGAVVEGPVLWIMESLVSEFRRKLGVHFGGEGGGTGRLDKPAWILQVGGVHRGQSWLGEAEG